VKNQTLIPGLLFASLCLGMGLRSEPLRADAPQPAPVATPMVVREYRIHLLRDPTSQEVEEWTRRLAREQHDAQWLGDTLRRTPEGWDVRHNRLVLIRETGFVATGILLLSAFLYWMARKNPLSSNRMAHAMGALLLFLLFNGAILNSLLLYVDRFPASGYTDDLFRNPAHNEEDSWGGLAMMASHAALTNKSQTVYQHLLQDHGIKFQYPLTSTLLIVPFRNLPVTRILNGMCFALAWGIAALLAGLLTCGFRESPRQGPDSAQPASLPWALMGFILASGYTFTFYPILRGLLLGQVQTVILALFAAALLGYASGRKAVAGVLIGLACTIKPQLGFLLLWGLTRREFRFTAWACLTAALMGLIAISVYGLQNNLDYIRVLLFLSNHGEAYYANQTVNGLLNRIFFPNCSLSFNGAVYPVYNTWVHAGTIITAGVLVLWALLWKGAWAPKTKALDSVDFSMAALVATMAAPIAWEHHYGLMLPMFAFVFPLTFIRRDITGLILLALAFILVSHSFAITNYLADTHLNVLQTYILFGAILFMIQLQRLRRMLYQESSTRLLIREEAATPLF
jgi:alpha-1,2-mannosyltransferase